jgi:predicted ArsR family transcriptional regulator
MRRKALEIKLKILDVLKREGELSLRELERKVNTNCVTIKTQVEELEFFGKVKMILHAKSEANGRPYKTVRLV